MLSNLFEWLRNRAERIRIGLILLLLFAAVVLAMIIVNVQDFFNIRFPKRKRRMYFGYPISVYDTDLEKRLLKQISEAFPGWEIENPNQKCHQKGYDCWEKITGNGMDYFILEVLPYCHGGTFLSFRDGAWGAGVFTEARFLKNGDIPSGKSSLTVPSPILICRASNRLRWRRRSPASKAPREQRSPTDRQFSLQARSSRSGFHFSIFSMFFSR